MSRREQREQIFKLLFRIEFNTREEMPEQLRLFFEDEEINALETDKELITEKYNKIMERLPEIDEKINEVATGWNIERMGKVELSILRLAVYELLMDEEIPEGVAINEAVELGKKYGQDETPAFINGVLAKYTKSQEEYALEVEKTKKANQPAAKKENKNIVVHSRKRAGKKE